MARANTMLIRPRRCQRCGNEDSEQFVADYETVGQLRVGERVLSHSARLVFWRCLKCQDKVPDES